MKPVHIVCLGLCLCMLFQGGSGGSLSSPQGGISVHVTYTSAPKTVSSEWVKAIVEPATAPASDTKYTDAVYTGTRMKLYRGYSWGQAGLCVESEDWSHITIKFQELPGTEGQKELTIVDVRVEPKEAPAEACVYIRYLDNAGQERIICADRSNENYTLVYPLSTEPGLELTEEEQQNYGDLLLMGYLLGRVWPEKYRLSDSENYESVWEDCILAALFYNYGDTLPPYLTGKQVEIFDGEEQASIIHKTELDAFFQSTIGRPCLVQSTETEKELYPDLQPDQILLYPTDFYFKPTLDQAVREPDGSIVLYGHISGFELMYCDTICRILPTEGYLGGRLVSAKIYPAHIISHRAP